MCRLNLVNSTVHYITGTAKKQRQATSNFTVLEAHNPYFGFHDILICHVTFRTIDSVKLGVEQSKTFHTSVHLPFRQASLQPTWPLEVASAAVHTCNNTAFVSSFTSIEPAVNSRVAHNSRNTIAQYGYVEGS